jgi:hypothetical protein
MVTMARSRSLAGALLAPLVWVERARGRRRKALLMLYAAIGAIGATFVWRAVSLNGLPDLGDPFDVKAFEAYAVPEGEDAFALYRKAIGRLEGSPGGSDLSAMWGSVRRGWAKADPALRGWVGDNREALALWRRGTGRSKAVPIAPGDWKLALGAPPPTPERLTDFAWMALLEGTRLEEEGDLAGAWGWYDAAMRCSRHLGMHAPSDYRGYGTWIFSVASERASPWAADPRADAAMLRRALADLKEVRAMTVPNSEAFRADYVALMRGLDRPDDPMWKHDPGWSSLDESLPLLWPAVRYVRREPERSRRILCIIFAHWLAHADDPPGSRPKMAGAQAIGNHSYPDFPYDTPPGVRDAAHPLAPEELVRWVHSSLYALSIGPPFALRLADFDRERASQAVLLVTLAEQLYLRERGTLPEEAQDLVDRGYLDRLPEGYGEGPAPERD